MLTFYTIKSLQEVQRFFVPCARSPIMNYLCKFELYMGREEIFMLVSAIYIERVIIMLKSLL